MPHTRPGDEQFERSRSNGISVPPADFERSIQSWRKGGSLDKEDLVLLLFLLAAVVVCLLTVVGVVWGESAPPISPEARRTSATVERRPGSMVHDPNLIPKQETNGRAIRERGGSNMLSDPSPASGFPARRRFGGSDRRRLTGQDVRLLTGDHHAERKSHPHKESQRE